VSSDVLGEPSPVGVRDRAFLLEALPLLHGLDDEGLRLLAEHARNRVYGKGQVLVREGLQPTAFHIVLDGRVGVTRKDSSVLVGAGHTVGILAVLAAAPTHRATALEVTRTLEVPAAALFAAIDEDFSLTRNLLRLLAAALLDARGNLPLEPGEPPLGVHFETPRTLVELLVYLRASPVGQSSPIAALVAVARRMVECRFPAGHVLWQAGEASNDSYTLAYGHVRCTAPDGATVVVGANVPLGFLDVTSGRPRTFEARAETDVIAYRVKFEDFLTTLEVHSLLALRLLSLFAASLITTHESI
jgi:CRP-like cAMP-binding protein